MRLQWISIYVLLAAWTTVVIASSGVLHIQLETFANPYGRDAVGKCCSDPKNTSISASVVCPGECRTFLRVCAARVGPHWPEEPDLRSNPPACPLGLLVTPSIFNNSLEPQRDGLLLMRFPYKEWPGKLKLVLEAWHDVTGELFHENGRNSLEERFARLIVRVERRHNLIPGEDWLRRSVHVNIPQNKRLPPRRIIFTYALRLWPLSTHNTQVKTPVKDTTTTLESHSTTMIGPKKSPLIDLFSSTESTLNYDNHLSNTTLSFPDIPINTSSQDNFLKINEIAINTTSQSSPKNSSTPSSINNSISYLPINLSPANNNSLLKSSMLTDDNFNDEISAKTENSSLQQSNTTLPWTSVQDEGLETSTAMTDLPTSEAGVTTTELTTNTDTTEATDTTLAAEVTTTESQYTTEGKSQTATEFLPEEINT